MSAADQAPTGQVENNDYVMRQGQKGGPIPVQSDDSKVADPYDAATANSDAQLGMLAVSRSNRTS